MSRLLITLLVTSESEERISLLLIIKAGNNQDGTQFRSSYRCNRWYTIQITGTIDHDHELNTVDKFTIFPKTQRLKLYNTINIAVLISSNLTYVSHEGEQFEKAARA